MPLNSSDQRRLHTNDGHVVNGVLDDLRSDAADLTIDIIQNMRLFNSLTENNKVFIRAAIRRANPSDEMLEAWKEQVQPAQDPPIGFIKEDAVTDEKSQLWDFLNQLTQERTEQLTRDSWIPDDTLLKQKLPKQAAIDAAVFASMERAITGYQASSQRPTDMKQPVNEPTTHKQPTATSPPATMTHQDDKGLLARLLEPLEKKLAQDKKDSLIETKQQAMDHLSILLSSGQLKDIAHKIAEKKALEPDQLRSLRELYDEIDDFMAYFKSGLEPQDIQALFKMSQQVKQLNIAPLLDFYLDRIEEKMPVDMATIMGQELAVQHALQKSFNSRRFMAPKSRQRQSSSSLFAQSVRAPVAALNQAIHHFQDDPTDLKPLMGILFHTMLAISLNARSEDQSLLAHCHDIVNQIKQHGVDTSRYFSEVFEQFIEKNFSNSTLTAYHGSKNQDAQPPSHLTQSELKDYRQFQKFIDDVNAYTSQPLEAPESSSNPGLAPKA